MECDVKFILKVCGCCRCYVLLWKFKVGISEFVSYDIRFVG